MTACFTLEEVLERFGGDLCELSLEEDSDFKVDGIYGYMLRLITLSAWQLCAVKGAECWGRR